jgi:hypothetical protein
MLRGATTPKVFDLGWKFLPDIHDNKSVQYCIDFVAYVLPVMFGPQIATQHISYMIVLMLIRSICTLVTILPKYKSCDDGIFGIKELVFGHCYDKIFSGHFASFLLLTLLLLEKGVWSLFIIAPLCIFYGILIICLRYHYTIDIIVAFFVTMYVFQNNMKINL